MCKALPQKLGHTTGCVLSAQSRAFLKVEILFTKKSLKTSGRFSIGVSVGRERRLFLQVNLFKTEYLAT